MIRVKWFICYCLVWCTLPKSREHLIWSALIDQIDRDWRGKKAVLFFLLNTQFLIGLNKQEKKIKLKYNQQIAQLLTWMCFACSVKGLYSFDLEIQNRCYKSVLESITLDKNSPQSSTYLLISLNKLILIVNHFCWRSAYLLTCLSRKKCINFLGVEYIPFVSCLTPLT